MDIGIIVGSCRSGTSILWEAVCAHPNVKGVWEKHAVWEDKYFEAYHLERLIAEQATYDVVNRVRDFFRSQQEPAKMIVTKNPINILRIPYVKSIFPEAKLIHIVRDGRDVTCSLRVGMKNGQWHFQHPPSWKQLCQEENLTNLCAKTWKETMEIALKDLETVDHLQIRLEDLINTPIITIMRVMEYLNLFSAKEVSEFCTKIQNSTDGYKATWDKWENDQWYTPHKNRIGRYKEDLNEEQIKEINVILKPMLERLGYK